MAKSAGTMCSFSYTDQQASMFKGIYYSIQMCTPYSICFVSSASTSLYFFFPKHLQRGSKDSSEKQKVLDLLRPKDLFSDLCLKGKSKPAPKNLKSSLPPDCQNNPKLNGVHQPYDVLFQSFCLVTVFFK